MIYRTTGGQLPEDFEYNSLGHLMATAIKDMTYDELTCFAAGLQSALHTFTEKTTDLEHVRDALNEWADFRLQYEEENEGES